MKHLQQQVKTLLLALIIGAGTVFAFGAWTEPISSSPEDNTAAPLNESTTMQTKPGVLSVSNEVTKNATTSADLLTVFGGSVLSEGVFVGDDELGTGSVDAHVTGKIGVNLDQISDTAMPTEVLDVFGTARIASLDSVNNPYAAYSSPICIGADGMVVLCEEGEAPGGVAPSWHTLGLMSPYGDPGQSCNDWLAENYPAWDGTAAHKRIAIIHDGDFVAGIAGTTTYLTPGYGGCIWGNTLSGGYYIQDNAAPTPTDDIYFPAPWGTSGSFDFPPLNAWGIPEGVGSDGTAGFFYQMQLYY